MLLPFHTVHGVLKARTLKWLAIPFSKEPRSVRTLHHDPSILGGPTWHGSLGPALNVDSLPAEPPAKPVYLFNYHLICQLSVKLPINHLSNYPSIICQITHQSSVNLLNTYHLSVCLLPTPLLSICLLGSDSLKAPD